MNKVTHTYSFNIFPHGPVTTRCIFIYESQSVIDNYQLEQVARSILGQATVLWIQGQNQGLDSTLNMSILKEHFRVHNNHLMLQLLEPFHNLVIDNDRRTIGLPSDNNIIIRLN